MLKILDATKEDLDGILLLQEANFKVNLTSLEIENQGFVTVRHTQKMLLRMNTPFPHTIAKEGEFVIGYALTMLPTFSNDIPELKAMFTLLGALENYVVMGQICIDKAFRSKGIFRSMYEFMKLKFRGEFDFIVTEVALENERSLSAHRAIGFKDYCTRADWVILLLEVDK